MSYLLVLGYKSVRFTRIYLAALFTGIPTRFLREAILKIHGVNNGEILRMAEGERGLSIKQ